MEISFRFNSITGDHIATKFGTCHDSPAVVPCVKHCSDHFISIWMRAKWNFHHIWIVMEKLLVKWAPGSQSGALCRTGYLSETYLKLKPSEVSFAHILFHIDSIVLKCCTLHSGDTDVICAKYQKHVKTERDVMDYRDFPSFEFQMNFGRISAHTGQPHWRQIFFSYAVPRWKFNISRVKPFWGLPNVHLCLIGAVELLS